MKRILLAAALALLPGAADARQTQIGDTGMVSPYEAFRPDHRSGNGWQQLYTSRSEATAARLQGMSALSHEGGCVFSLQHPKTGEHQGWIAVTAPDWRRCD